MYDYINTFIIPHRIIITIGFSFVFLTRISAVMQIITELILSADNFIFSEPKKANARIIAAADAIRPSEADFSPFSISLKYAE